MLARGRGVFHFYSFMHIQTKSDTYDHVLFWSRQTYTVVVVYNVPWVNPDRHTHTHTLTDPNPRLAESQLWPTMMSVVPVHDWPEVCREKYFVAVYDSMSCYHYQILDCKTIWCNRRLLFSPDNQQIAIKCWFTYKCYLGNFLSNVKLDRMTGKWLKHLPYKQKGIYIIHLNHAIKVNWDYYSVCTSMNEKRKNNPI